MARERFKTFLLTVLFVSSIVLTAANLNMIDCGKKISFNIDANEEKREAYSLFKPDRMFVHFGGGGGNNIEMIEQKQAYWNEIKPVLKEAVLNRLETSEKDAYEIQQIKQLKSVEISFPLAVSGSFLTKVIGLEKSKLDKYKDIDNIIIPLVDDRGIYFLSGSGSAVRVERAAIRESAIISELEDKLEKGELVRYYTMDSILPVQNNVLMPVDASGYKYSYFRSRNVTDIYDESSVVGIARRIFDEKYDFVNRVVETKGANTFIYGFGEKVLRIQPDGAIDYLDETAKESQGGREEALSKAVEFAYKAGANVEALSLKSVKESQAKGKTSYEVEFSYDLDGLKLKAYDSNMESIRVTVIGNGVYSYFSNIKGIEDNMTVNLFSNSEMMSPQTILSDNFDFLKKEFESNIQEKSKDFDSEFILDNINAVEIVYFLESTQVLIPAWCFYVGEQEYVFDAYTGEVLNYGLGKS